MPRANVLVFALAATLAAVAMAASPLPATVYFADNTYSFVSGKSDPTGAAFGTWTDNVLVTGWGTFEVSTNATFTDEEQMFAAGFLEGATTAARIVEMYANVLNFFWPTTNEPTAAIVAWFALNDAWMREQVNAHNGDKFWTTVGLMVTQMDGLAAGYNSVAANGEQLPLVAFQILSSTGDLLNLVNVVDPTLRPNFAAMSDDELAVWFHKHTMCTGAIRYTPTGDDILASHSAWFTYGAMNRIVKQYNLQLTGSQIIAKQLSFSSYPGFLISLDDYYIMRESGLTMVQTTNAIFNNALLNVVNTSSLLSWVSVRLANHMANSGEEWFQLDAKLNSGLYSNQYMVIDRKLFTPGQGLAKNTFWVMDQIPGLTEGSDLTDELAAGGYYGSYNSPWRGHKRIIDASGYNTAGASMSYDMAPRAILFRAYAQNITDIESLMFFARYNDYKNDPLEMGNPMNAIASRGDLAGLGAFGAIDSKVSNISMMESLSFYAINGPTNVQQPTFTWTSEFDNTTHAGCPETYDFAWELFTPPW